MNDTLITIFTVVSGGLTTAVGMLWKFVQSRFAVQDRLLQECRDQHISSDKRYDTQTDRMLEMSTEIGTLRAKVEHAMAAASRETSELRSEVRQVQDVQDTRLAKENG